MIAKMMLAATCAIAAMASTDAAAQTYTYTYAGTGTATVNTVGSFTINQAGTAFSLTAFSGTIGGPSYNLSEVGLGLVNSRVYLGGLLTGVDRVAAGTKDFFQSGEFAPGTATFTDTFRYSTVGTNTIPTSAPVVFTLVPTSVQSAVPEPAAWAMMIGGFGLVGGTMRRRQKVKTTVRFA